MKRLIGLAAFIFSVIVLIQIGVSISAFWDLPIFLFILISSLGLTIAKVDLESLKKIDSTAMISLSKNLKHSGILGLIIGLIQIMHNLSDFTQIGPPIGICLLSVFYAVALRSIIAIYLK